jgi:hypothetical protein
MARLKSCTFKTWRNKEAIKKQGFYREMRRRGSLGRENRASIEGKRGGYESRPGSDDHFEGLKGIERVE